jgi:ABC-2 type transport system ATP-binding protein
MRVQGEMILSDHIIETQDLTVYYGKHRGIVDVSLSVQRGEVFGFLGPNGAGKTTTQRVLVDVIRPTNGHATIFGRDCQKEGVAIRKRIGYLPGELSLYPNMRGRDFLHMLASLQEKKVERTYRQQLYDRLDLDPSRKMKEYSHGNKQKIGIVAAFMGQPDLLILDEPTTGLDPLVQQTVMELVTEAKDDGRTVFFSSHILPEVQAVCDRVGIIREGQLIKTERVETLTKQQFKRLHLTLRQSPPVDAFAMDGVKETGREGQIVMLEIRQGLDRVMEIAVPYGIEDLDTLPVTLEEIFLAFYNRQNQGGN